MNKQSESLRIGYKVMTRLTSAGFDTWIVGGAVRDKYLQRNVRDVDLLTAASREDIEQLFENVHAVGAKHGTLLVVIEKTAVEVTVMQTETVEEDLAARDFTINAMAEKHDGSIVDPFNGLADLTLKTIRSCTADGSNFDRDPLRMLRAYRLAMELAFKIDDAALAQIQARKALISEPAAERLAAEFDKIALCRPGPSDWELFFFAPIFPHFPLIFREESLVQSLQKRSLPAEGDALLHWWTAASYTADAVSPAAVLSYYRRSNQLKKDTAAIAAFLAAAPPTAVDLYHLGEKRLITASFLYECLYEDAAVGEEWRQMYERLPIKQRKEMQTDGKKILREHPFLTGQQVGVLLNEAEMKIVQGSVLNEETALADWIRSRIK
ncbi:hypothetical protein [Salisediminibacterium halotolerans]|uniref:hypothetical protein n=1 Tax=Salisediminibacterium halotolerans TaxID=517425 RepID=UPI000EAEE82C|nr:hypothetical protein [Salisediminibacterium halotolerans]RLJ77916.1 tRNA nucleotidyltransferase (CCA-adding enzyme) [Actinophytocola xinjiangensis]RPE88746.1 tRNA nucleotidyltransferase (CCA-adding enzyme) [Salisediminibacterium halotolerans]TWG36893.1 tRNA nucleotidyltransferase (CCA-adding enzyme) [Salisediminibacterium halotolerans]GEL07421.1 CCA-adding enzyme [Salisediminibacterium halotolerans]